MNGYISMYRQVKYIPKNVYKPIFYKKRLNAYKGAFYSLVAVTTMIAARFFYYG